MQKIILLLFSVLLISLVSCKDDTKEASIEDIEGTWNFTEVEQDGTVSFVDDSTNMLVEIDVLGVGTSFDATATFTESTFTFNGTYSGNSTISSDGEVENSTFEDDELDEAGTLSLANNKLTLTNTDGQAVIYDVIECSDSKLVIEGNIMETDPFFGIDVDTNIRYGFSR